MILWSTQNFQIIAFKHGNIDDLNKNKNLERFSNHISALFKEMKQKSAWCAIINF